MPFVREPPDQPISNKSVTLLGEKPRSIFLRPSTDLIARDLREYDPRDHRYLRKDRCFLCGVKLTPTTRTAEHVFPKWLLNRYGLWDHRISLLNRTDISYRQVRVPSCKRCNNVFLGALERRVRRAVEGGYEAFNTLSRPVIFQWLTKIYFQILYSYAWIGISLSPDIVTPTWCAEIRQTGRRPGHFSDTSPTLCPLDGAAAYELRMPIAFDRLFTTIVPALQVGMASLTRLTQVGGRLRRAA